MMQSEQINELAAALAKAQGAMANAATNKANPHFKSKYADLSAVIDAVRGPLSANGISFIQTMGVGERGFMLRTALVHSSGQYIATEYPLPAAGRPQEMGAAQTYARRYSLAAIVGIAQEDDDGNTAKAIESGGKVVPINTNGSGKISADDLEVLRKLIDEREADVPKLCNYFKINSLADITIDILPKVTAALKAKRISPHA